MVAGDHADPDAGRARGADNLADVRPGRIVERRPGRAAPAPPQAQPADVPASRPPVPGAGADATAMILNPLDAISSTSSAAAAPESPQSGRTDSGAPLTKRVVPVIADSRRRRGSKANRRTGRGLRQRGRGQPTGQDIECGLHRVSLRQPLTAAENSPPLGGCPCRQGSTRRPPALRFLRRRLPAGTPPP